MPRGRDPEQLPPPIARLFKAGEEFSKEWWPNARLSPADKRRLLPDLLIASLGLRDMVPFARSYMLEGVAGRSDSACPAANPATEMRSGYAISALDRASPLVKVAEPFLSAFTSNPEYRDFAVAACLVGLRQGSCAATLASLRIRSTRRDLRSGLGVPDVAAPVALPEARADSTRRLPLLGQTRREAARRRLRRSFRERWEFPLSSAICRRQAPPVHHEPDVPHFATTPRVVFQISREPVLDGGLDRLIQPEELRENLKRLLPVAPEGAQPMDPKK